MEELKNRAQALESLVQDAFKRLAIDKKTNEISELDAKTADPDYWQKTDNSVAQSETKRLAVLRELVAPWVAMKKSIDEIQEFIELKDDSMTDDLTKRLERVEQKYESAKADLRFSGEHDGSNVVMTIQSGAGGNDAQDWAQMLQRMYIRWAEKSDMKVTTLSETSGEEAGIKNSSLLIEGVNAFGKLKGEHGVHRLVRLSPFNSANSRETSFAMVEIVPEIESPEEIDIDESDLRVDVFRAGGHGGQSVNTTDSAVRLTHEPTGIVVSIQNERSQQQNKETALKVLKSKLAQLAEEQHKEKVEDLRGPNVEAAWGNQIRSYVLHPYTLVKDTRSNYQTSDVQEVLSGGLEELIDTYLDTTMGE